MTLDEQDWLDSLSDDPNEPSLMAIGAMGDFAFYHLTVTVAPGEIVYVYRRNDGVVLAGWPCVTVH